MNIINNIRKWIEERQRNKQRDYDVESGYFLFYIIDEGTNIRKHNDDGLIMIFSDKDIAEDECESYDIVIRISEYNRLFPTNFLVEIHD